MIEYKKCQEYNPLSAKANRLGMETFWRAFDTETEQYFYGKTKAETTKKVQQTRR